MVDQNGTAIDLNRMHHAVHQVSGDMALKFNSAAPADLERWAAALRLLADEMVKAAFTNGEDRDA